MALPGYTPFNTFDSLTTTVPLTTTWGIPVSIRPQTSPRFRLYKLGALGTIGAYPSAWKRPRSEGGIKGDEDLDGEAINPQPLKPVSLQPSANPCHLL